MRPPPHRSETNYEFQTNISQSRRSRDRHQRPLLRQNHRRERSHLARPDRRGQTRPRAGIGGRGHQRQLQRRDDRGLRPLESEPRAGRENGRAGLWARAALLHADGRSAGAEGRGRGDHRHRRLPACAHAQAGRRGRQGRLLRKAHGQRAGRGQGRPRRRALAKAGRADRHPAPQRAVSDRGQGIDRARRARRRQQSGDGVELSRPALARPRQR